MRRKTTTTIQLSRQMLRELRDHCAGIDISMASFVRQAIADKLASDMKPQKGVDEHGSEKKDNPTGNAIEGNDGSETIDNVGSKVG